MRSVFLARNRIDSSLLMLCWLPRWSPKPVRSAAREWLGEGDSGGWWTGPWNKGVSGIYPPASVCAPRVSAQQQADSGRRIGLSPRSLRPLQRDYPAGIRIPLVSIADYGESIPISGIRRDKADTVRNVRPILCVPMNPRRASSQSHICVDNFVFGYSKWL
ncbi:hypothetical protein KM043_013475 [Ampulex compressa]|nr:hypothetical protein KM043_013475 [Ampulex compressa]